MTAGRLVSLETYFATEYELGAEYVDGFIEERYGGLYDHSCWQHALLMWFAERAKAWNVRVLMSYTVKVAPTRYRIPDLTVFARGEPSEPILTQTPIAVFEVLSPEDRMPRVLKKLGDYGTMGVRTIVVINPETDTVYRYLNGVLMPSEEPTCPGSACLLDWDKIRQLRD